MKALRRALLAWYAMFGRASLPWRTSRDPYFTLVSEFMLQQTQVDRVVPKFEAFVARFPDVRSLAGASTADVLRAWQGLGYNSRALRLQQAARAVVERFAGELPRDLQALLSLPGIGPYTAAAIRAFAFDECEAPLDTNIRRIVHRVFFGIEYPEKARYAELDERARAMVPADAAHDWNSALMDLGAAICTARAPKCALCPLVAHCVTAPVDAAALETARREYGKKRSPQNAVPFERTNRYARGRIIDALRTLAPGRRISLLDLHGDLASLLPDRSLEDVRALVATLERDGLVAVDGVAVALSE
ncbi:MAG TPA: A/G-specific adenine glycosylase [Candidatus Baltobacteraceae bacterium]|nr:A/G-specific adenine glycosylase [Candidatus Baltobacteraceae bacterium]